MSGMRAFDSSTTLTVSEGYDLTNQQHYSKRRCRCSCDFLNKKCSFRVWHILLFLFIIALVMVLMGLLLAMYGPGTTDLKYSAARSGTDSPGVVGGQDTKKPTGVAATTTTTATYEGTTAPGKETTSVKPTERQTTVVTTKRTTQETTAQPTTIATTKEPETTALPIKTNHSTTAKLTTPVTTRKTTGQTTAAPTTRPPTTTEAPTTTSPPTTQAPTTIIPSDKTFLECGVAIVGGGTGGLLMAYALLDKKDETNETNVCVFEREDRLGGKIFDFNFTLAPDFAVGLGEWNIYGDNYDLQDLQFHLGIQADLWLRKIHRVEARGVFTDSFDSLKSKAFPTLQNRFPMNNKTLMETAKFIYDAARNYTPFSTAETFLSYELTPEGAKLMEENFDFMGDYMQDINPLSYRTYLEEKYHVISQSQENKRPKTGMSEFITKLAERVQRGGGKIYPQQTVTSIDKREDKFVLQTTSFFVKANKTVLTAGPTALKKIKGDVMQNITGHDIFKSIVSVPAFHGAAVYQTAWWNDSIAAQKNNSLKPLDMFISSSDCLGITMPYNGVGPNGRAVLHTIANNGGCSDKWGEILKISEKEVDKELKRALKYKFQREDVPDPLKTRYKYWDEGFWFLQKPGVNFSLNTIKEWAVRPLTGEDVFLVDRAFYSFGGWLEDTIKSAVDALDEGWNVKFAF